MASALLNRLQAFFPTTPVHASIHPPSIVLPLYVYPNPNAWGPIFASINNNPKISFTIIINPSSGPGTTEFPDESYIIGVAELNSFQNVRLLGYVPLDYGKRDISAVKKDIDIYAGWKAYQEKSIGVRGIFFDESPSIYEKESFAYLEAVTRYPLRVLPLGSESVLNPGTVTDERICKLVDGVVGFEDFHQNFTEEKIRELQKSEMGNGKRKSVVMVHHLQGGAGEMKRVVDCCVKLGVGGLFVSDKEYDEVGDLWEDFCGIVAAIGN
jgi:hypothetical protein